MDSESLRKSYNETYKSSVENASITDPILCKNIVLKTAKNLPDNLKNRKNLKLLDIGCAKGFITEAFRVSGYDVHGVDYSDVAVEIAKKQFPKCRFTHMDAFNPCFEEKFDIIFCRGFSGLNTHDMQFVAGFLNKYVDLLNDKGVLVVSSASNFRDRSNRAGSWNYWSYKQIDELSGLIKGVKKTKFTIQENIFTRLKYKLFCRNIEKSFLFYIFYQKQ